MAGNVVGGSIDGGLLPLPSRNEQCDAERGGFRIAFALPIQSTDQYEVYLWDGRRWRLGSSKARIEKDEDG